MTEEEKAAIAARMTEDEKVAIRAIAELSQETPGSAVTTLMIAEKLGWAPERVNGAMYGLRRLGLVDGEAAQMN